MYLDSTLSMESFVNEKFKSCSFYLRNIARIRHYLTPSATKLLVHAFVISRIDYGNCLLFGINSSLLRRLQVLQNNAARLIYNQSRSCHATPLLLELHWLPVNQRIIFKILVFVFNCLNNRAPTYLSQLISPYKPNRSLRSASTNLLVTHRSLNRYGDRSFYFAAPRLWNNLPNHIRTAASLSSFKRSLKTYLFIECFNLNQSFCFVLCSDLCCSYCVFVFQIFKLLSLLLFAFSSCFILFYTFSYCILYALLLCALSFLR